MRLEFHLEWVLNSIVHKGLAVVPLQELDNSLLCLKSAQAAAGDLSGYFPRFDWIFKEVPGLQLTLNPQTLK